VFATITSKWLYMTADPEPVEDTSLGGNVLKINTRLAG
jgi:hypothetical protein